MFAVDTAKELERFARSTLRRKNWRIDIHTIRTKRALKTIAYNRLSRKNKIFAARAGRALGADYAFPSLAGSLRVLREWGYTPRFVVDVGAYIGDWTRDFRLVFPNARVLMVEPQPGKQRTLEEMLDNNTRLAADLLGASLGTNVQFLEMETGSSVYSELTDVPRKSILRTTNTLDAILQRDAMDWGTPDLLKLDVQGYEIEVLRGGSGALSRSDLVLLEVALLPYNDGAPLFHEVMDFMREAGYSLLDICSQMRRNDGALLQMDALFIRQSAWLNPANGRQNSSARVTTAS